MNTTPKHELGGANVFADIGLPDAETHLLKAQLVSRIQDILDKRGLSQTAASALMGIRQPDLSRILRGQFRGFSVERLMTMLAGLGFEVAITLKPEGAAVPTDIIRLPRLEPA
jgi:predicted XRE-type DNA-binding protein